MPEQNERMIEMIRSMVSGGQSMARVRENLSMMKIPVDEISSVVSEYELRTGRIRTLRRPVSVSRPGIVDWYSGPQEEDHFWPPLKRLLKDKNWSEDNIQSVDDASSKVLSLMQPPGLGTFSTRGLVLGHVQMGKTANYTALISKAADVGYKFFIVLSGMHNKLRAQTQKRLYEELIAVNTESWISVTDLDGDFGIRGLGNVDAFLTTRNPGHRVMGVVKKNGTVLTRLRDWLRNASDQVLATCPILIIDDEADQASINTTGDPEYRSKINNLILELLAIGPKIAYVGYTATPFANVFVDPDIDKDLYPSDFIVDLPRPDSYFGTESLFGRERIDSDDNDPAIHGLDMIRKVPMDELSGLQPVSRDSRADFSATITPSLRDALNYFWLATAARRARGDSEEHSSMLVHTTLYVDPHIKIQRAIHGYRDIVLSGLENRDPVLLEDLAMLWERESTTVSLPADNPRWTPFSQLQSFLIEVLKETTVPVENQHSLERLSYDEPGSVQIVVGGNVLSRGLTLDGLTVSYFVRTSTAYDTLLQMGRWFGYRPGYEELPRVWMTDELRRYFHDLATVEREIRDDIARYEQEQITPLDFAVRVRTHPKMSITAKSKMGAATASHVSHSDKRLQTILFRNRDSDWLMRNQSAARWLVNSATDEAGPFLPNLDSYRVTRGVRSTTIREFLRRYTVHPESHDVRTAKMSEYIADQNSHDDLTDWNVVIATQSSTGSLGQFDFGRGNTVPFIQRSQLGAYGALDYTSIGALLVGLDWVADLELDTPKSELTRMSTADLRGLREEDNFGSIILYPISKDSEPAANERNQASRLPLNATEHVIGIGVVFPKANRDELQSFMSVDLSHQQGEEDELPDEGVSS